MRIILIGFACSYKSSVGKLLAEKLNYKHVDTDRLVEETARKSIVDIFEQQSELEFRRLESWTLLRASYLDDAVISCGGGGPLHSAFDKLAAGSTVVWLTAVPETVYSRLGGERRPLFDNASVEQLSATMEVRAPYYEKHANYVVATDGKTSEQVANEIVALLDTTR